MSISFTCQKCRKLYELPENLAGKRARCKQCGTEFRVPTPAGAATAAGGYGVDDPYGFADAAPPSPRPIADEDEEFSPPPRIGPKKTATKNKNKKAAANKDSGGLFYWGVRFMIFGAGVFILPLVGLQWKFLSFLAEEIQLGIGVVFLAIGSFCVLASGASIVISLIGFVGVGLGLIVFLLVLGAQGQQKQQVANPPGMPPPVVMPQPPPDFQIPRPNFQTPPPSIPNYPPNAFPSPTPNYPGASSIPPPTYPGASPSSPPGNNSGFPQPPQYPPPGAGGFPQPSNTPPTSAPPPSFPRRFPRRQF